MNDLKPIDLREYLDHTDLLRIYSLVDNKIDQLYSIKFRLLDLDYCSADKEYFDVSDEIDLFISIRDELAKIISVY